MSKQYSRIKEGLTDSSFSPLFWLLFVVGVVFVVAVLYVCGVFNVVGVNTSLSDNGADVFLKYLFIVVAVERAAAVFVGITQKQNRIDWTLRIKRLNEVLQSDNPHLSTLQQVYAREHKLIDELERAELIGEIGKVTDNDDREKHIGYLTSVKHIYEFQKAQFDSVANRYVSRIVFFSGMALALVGLSVFADLIVVSEEIAGYQLWFLKVSDILVTGGLLGGGSAGLNVLANKVSDSMA